MQVPIWLAMSRGLRPSVSDHRPENRSRHQLARGVDADQPPDLERAGAHALGVERQERDHDGQTQHVHRDDQEHGEERPGKHERPSCHRGRGGLAAAGRGGGSSASMIMPVRSRGSWRGCVGVCLVLAAATNASAQDASEPDAPFAFGGPAAPAPPAVITRDDQGRATVRATRLTAPLRVDGRLDEAVYSTLAADQRLHPAGADRGACRPPRRPRSGCCSTTGRLRDRSALWESRPDAMVANEMRRDSNNIFQNDNVAFLLRHVLRPPQRHRVRDQPDRRPAGTARSRTSAPSTATGTRSGTSRSGRFEGGWTVETAIPFKSLRYRPGRAQIWGFNVRRIEPVEERDVAS